MEKAHGQTEIRKYYQTNRRHSLDAPERPVERLEKHRYGEKDHPEKGIRERGIPVLYQQSL